MRLPSRTLSNAGKRALVKHRPEISISHVQQFVCPNQTAPCLKDRGFDETCFGCSAITLGRVAWVCPGQIAPHLVHFVGPWCNALRSIRDDVEKEHAFLGLCALLRANPEVFSRPPFPCLGMHLASVLPWVSSTPSWPGE